MYEIESNEFDNIEPPDEETLKFLERAGKLNDAAIEALKGQSDDTIVKFTCPLCNGTANARRASCNGHKHIRCESCKTVIME